MIVISHRGNLNGPDTKTENHPDQILKAIKLGLDVEVDVWFKDDSFFFGHDYPQYEISDEFLLSIIDNAWIHCKNLEALEVLSQGDDLFRYFWHENDNYTITSNEKIWTLPGNKITNHSVCVLPEKYPNIDYSKAYGVCTDFPLNIV
jgi:hypothetical protein